MKLFIFLLVLAFSFFFEGHNGSLLISIEFNLKLPSGEEIPSAGLFGDLLRVTSKRGPRRNPHKYEKKLDHLLFQLASKKISSQAFYEKAGNYIEGGTLEGTPKVYKLQKEVVGIAGEREISNRFQTWLRIASQNERAPAIFSEEALETLNPSFYDSEKKKKYFGVAYLTENGRIRKFKTCLNGGSCWSWSSSNANGLRVEEVEMTSHIDAMGYSAESRALKDSLSEYFKSEGRLTKSIDEITEDLKKAFKAVYVTQLERQKFFISDTFAGFVVTEGGERSKIEFIDDNYGDMQASGVEVKTNYYSGNLEEDAPTTSHEAAEDDVDERELRTEEFERRINEGLRSRIGGIAAKRWRPAPSAPLAEPEEIENIVEEAKEEEKVISKIAKEARNIVPQLEEEALQQRTFLSRLGNAIAEFFNPRNGMAPHLPPIRGR